MNIPKKHGAERITYKGRMIEVVEQDMLIGDKVVVFEKARRAPGVRLIVVTPENKLKLSKEYRSEIKDYDYRLPGGKVFDSLDEYNTATLNGIDINKEAEIAAKKEAREEIGIDPKEIELFGISHAGATIDWDLYYFVVSSYEDLGSQELEDGEVIETIEMTFPEVKDLCLSGKIREDRSVAKLLQFIEKTI